MRTATVIPDNERWLHSSQAAAGLQNALAWATAYRDGDFIRLLTIAPDHDSTYAKK